MSADRKPFHKPRNLLTIYGRKPVQEALHDSDITFFRVHLAHSNKANPVLQDIIAQCHRRGIEVLYHDRLALSRISKNRKQDQGVAADIIAKNFTDFEDYLASPDAQTFSLIALDQITNPQNLGMIIRSVCAGYMDGLLIPRRGCAKIDSLVIKASAGTLFKAKLLFCDDLVAALEQAKVRGIAVYGLSATGSQAIGDITLRKPRILVLGNETEGLSAPVANLCDTRIHIPMRNRVESLNVAVTAGILAFHPLAGQSIANL
jgi:23S rRNA (guanosine2251-2'-O)-methyltransferase